MFLPLKINNGFQVISKRKAEKGKIFISEIRKATPSARHYIKIDFSF